MKSALFSPFAPKSGGRAKNSAFPPFCAETGIERGGHPVSALFRSAL
jgi:hypothetical protein